MCIGKAENVTAEKVVAGQFFSEPSSLPNSEMYSAAVELIAKQVHKNKPSKQRYSWSDRKL